MKRIIFLPLLTFFIVSLTIAQQPWTTGTPITSSARLTKTTAWQPPVFKATLPETLDAVFDSITALTPIKGFNAAMLLPDGTYWKRAHGLAEEFPASKPLTTSHLMGMGSITKTFVSTTLLLLMEDGLLALDDSIGQYVGPYPNVPGQVTVRQLLSHRSGISDYLNENPATTDAFFANIDSIWSADTLLYHYVLPPNFPPDAAWSYSNTNYLLAGLIIESVAGQPWHQMVRQRLLNPLNLHNTFVYPFESPGNLPFAHVFVDLDGDGNPEDWQGQGLPDAGLFSLAGSAGCIITNPEDLTRFVQLLFSGQVLQPATLAAMQTDYVQNPTLGLVYGLGAVSFTGLTTLENWGHDGDLLYKTVALYFPSENMALSIQQNDDRSYGGPADPNQTYDVYVVFQALLETYLNYSPTSATDESAVNLRLKVFPNPVSDFLQIDFGANTGLQFPLSCVITDMNGRMVASQILENQQSVISVEQLPQGIFAVKAGNATGLFLKK